MICPMIEENEKMDLENVEEYARMLSQALPPSITVEALNGHMRPQKRMILWNAFRRMKFRF